MFEPPPPPLEPAPRPARPRTWPRVVFGVALAVVLILGVTSTLDSGPGDSPGVFDLDASGAVSLSHESGDLAEVIPAALQSLEQYWRNALPDTYDTEFTPLAGGFQAKTSGSAPWTCAGQRHTYRDIQGNAYYCRGGADDYIAYDLELLMPQLDQSYGSVSPAIVLAHEMGHAIQSRIRVEAPSVLIELQADCFAGAWSRFADETDDDPIELGEGALDSAIAAILTLRDQPGTPGTNPQAHGLGFDRVNAFQTGYEDGVDSCAQFPSGRNVVTTEMPFRTREEALSGGNLAYADALPIFVESLDTFWAAGLPPLSGTAFQSPRPAPVAEPPLRACDSDGYDVNAAIAYCADTRTVSWAQATLATLHTQVGDLASGAALSELWSRAAQDQGGLEVAGREAELQRDCFTGAWLATLAGDRPETSLLSPGDIDEVLTTVTAGVYAMDDADRAGTFERTDALRTGLLEGLAACR